MALQRSVSCAVIHDGHLARKDHSLDGLLGDEVERVSFLAFGEDVLRRLQEAAR